MTMKIHIFLSLVLTIVGAMPALGVELFEEPRYPQYNEPRFTLLSSEQTGVHFNNTIVEDARNNQFVYEYIYSGGGVAVGDVNNDGLVDLYFAGNMTSNRLYLNKGGMVFEDSTEKAGIKDDGGWSAGVTMIDINLDGFLDIYVCRSYFRNDPDKRRNLLYLNNGDGSFTESAASLGLDDPGFGVQAAFFDYDHDGDLDVYIANHLRYMHHSIEERVARARQPNLSSDESDRLYRNNGAGGFEDVSREAGIINYGCGLGLGIGDLNQDGWPDVYVANDYQEPDFLYINQGDGTFKESLKESVKHTSYWGMGTELVDLNGDSLLDIVVLDMSADDNYLQKTMMASMAPEEFWNMVDYGYGYQYMRNTLQLNNGTGTFSEIGYYSGIASTGWSWAVLAADFGNFGRKDLFVTNGFLHDPSNKDARAKIDKILAEQGGQIQEGQIMELLSYYPVNKMTNFYLGAVH